MDTVTQPVLQGRAAPAACSDLERLLAAGACKGRILIVEDIPDTRDLLCEVLRREGYFTLQACDGLECLRQAKTRRPDLILLNYLMPRMDGLTALRELKMNPVISYLKVVMYSAISDFDRFRAAALEGGAVDCLRTPFSLPTLLEAVARALRS